jgi:hypothetical protein
MLVVLLGLLGGGGQIFAQVETGNIVLIRAEVQANANVCILRWEKPVDATARQDIIKRLHGTSRVRSVWMCPDNQCVYITRDNSRSATRYWERIFIHARVILASYIASEGQSVQLRSNQDEVAGR